MTSNSNSNPPTRQSHSRSTSSNSPLQTSPPYSSIHHRAKQEPLTKPIEFPESNISPQNLNENFTNSNPLNTLNKSKTIQPVSHTLNIHTSASMLATTAPSGATSPHTLIHSTVTQHSSTTVSTPILGHKSNTSRVPPLLNDVHPGSFFPPRNTMAASAAQIDSFNNSQLDEAEPMGRGTSITQVKYIPTLTLHPENVIKEVKSKIASARRRSDASSRNSSIMSSAAGSQNSSSVQLSKFDQPIPNDHDTLATSLSGPTEEKLKSDKLASSTGPTNPDGSKISPIHLPSTAKLPRSVSLLHLRGTRKKLVLGMIGLPARGKTYIARKICRYLNWTGYSCKVFNIGSYRRKMCGADKDASFFDPTNPEGVAHRTLCAKAALNDMIDFFEQGGNSAVYDGTNSTSNRRQMVIEMLQQRAEETGMYIELVWIESICHDQEIIEANIRETKLTSPDYIRMPEADATKDFINRIKMYEKVYESLTSADNDMSYLQIIDAGRQVITNRIYGYLMGKIVFFVMNLRINRAPIYISRHGESLFNIEDRIGGDSALSPNGHQYAKTLAKFIREEFPGSKIDELAVWTSTLRRTVQTAAYLGLPVTQWRALIEIQVGICDSMTYAEIEKKYPEEFIARKNDKLCYRYPNGESYMDVIQRIEPCIFELERMQSPVLLIIHRAVARCLLAYFLDQEPETIPYMNVDLHTVLKLTPKAYSCDVQKFKLPIHSCEEDDEVQRKRHDEEGIEI